MEPTDKQIQWLWEQCGFKFSHTANDHNFFTGKTGRQTTFWEYPDGNCAALPPIDLNSLFKYAVPKTREQGYMLDLSSGMLASNTTVILYKSKNDIYKGFNEDPALALFWAIYKTLGGE